MNATEKEILMKTPLHILHIEDNDKDAEFISATLAEEGVVCEITRTETKRDFLKLISSKKFDLILSDYKLPSFNGLEALKIAQEKIPTVPFILLSGTIGEESAIESLLNGATDYVLKDNIKRLVPAIHRALKEVELRQEKIMSEERLREGERNMRHLIETAAEIIYSIDTTGRFIEANPAALRSMKFTLKELRQLNYYDLILPDHRQRIMSMYQLQFKKTQASTYVEVPIRSKSNDVRWFGQNASIRLENDAVGGLNLIARDITEQKKTEAALLESEERFHRLFTASPDAILLIDPYDPKVSWPIIDCNEAACKMNGYAREELVGQSIDILNISTGTADEREAYLEGLRQKSVTSLETFHRHKDGHTFPVEVSTSLVTIQGREIILGIDRDITERRRMEESLRRVITDARCLLWHAYVVQRETGYEWELRVSNEDAAMQFLPMNVASGETYSDAWQESKFEEEQASLEKNYIGALEHQKPGYRQEFRCRLADGSVRWLLEDVSITPLVPGKWEFVGVCTDITERKKAEEALTLYRHAIKSIMECVTITDLQNNLLFVNQAFLTTYGYAEEELIGKPIDIVTADPAIKEQDIIEGTFRGGWQGEIINRKKDGTLFPVFLSTSVIRDEKGEPLALVGVATDITERKHAEEFLRMNESLLSNALKIAQLGHWKYDVASDLFTFNDHFYAMLHTTAEKEGGYTMTSSVYAQRFVHPDDLPLVGMEIQKALETTDPNYTSQLEHRIFYADGEHGHISVRIFVKKDETGRTIKTYGVNQDITKRKQAEEQLLRQTTYFQQLFENSPEGIILLDEKNRIVNVNNAFEKIFGYSLEEIKEKNIDDFIVAPEKRDEALQLSKEAIEGKSVQKDSVRKRKDGSLVDVIIICYPIVINDRRVGAYGMYVDISERKRLQEQLVHAQRMESIGTLAGGVAHDFNNILGIIMGHATLMENLPQEPSKRAESIRTILQATQRGAMLVRQLLAFARKSQVYIEPIKVNAAIQETIKLLSETLPKTIAIATRLQDALPAIVVDSTQLQQVLLNLCVNARDAMPDGGTLTISTQMVEGELLQKKFIKVPDKQYVVIHVADTGMGMDEETRKRIFEPFYTTKEKGKGTGLGLAVVFGIIENHDGFIDVASETGKGTTFSLYFPVRKHEVKKEESKPESAATALRGTETVLIIEDEVLLKELLKAMLSAKGYTVLTAEDGEEGIRIYTQRASQIALVLSDFGLPKFDGFEVLKRLKQITPSLQFVLATGYIEPEERSLILQNGAKEIIQKPYTPESVMRTIREVLDRAK